MEQNIFKMFNSCCLCLLPVASCPHENSTDSTVMRRKTFRNEDFSKYLPKELKDLQSTKYISF